MKTLILMRHGEAQALSVDGIDFNKTLTSNGLKQAMSKGEELRKKNIAPNLIVHSSAKRTTETFKEVNKTLQCFNKQSTKEIYNASLTAILNVVHEIDKSNDVAMVIGHNPGISELAEHLCSNYSGWFSPSDVLILSFEDSQWRDITGKTAKLIGYL